MIITNMRQVKHLSEGLCCDVSVFIRLFAWLLWRLRDKSFRIPHCQDHACLSACRRAVSPMWTGSHRWPHTREMRCTDDGLAPHSQPWAGHCFRNRAAFPLSDGVIWIWDEQVFTVPAADCPRLRLYQSTVHLDHSTNENCETSSEGLK